MEAVKYNKYEVEILLKLSKDQEFKLERIFDVYKQKGGKHFYHFTTKYKLVYIFYHENNIEVWGNNKQNVHDCIHEIIQHMKFVRKQQYKFKMLFLFVAVCPKWL